MAKSYNELRDEFLRQRMQFILAELDAGMTFAQVAQNERGLGNAERAARNIGHAMMAYEEARRRLAECQREDSPAEFDLTERKLAVLEETISNLHPAT